MPFKSLLASGRSLVQATAELPYGQTHEAAERQQYARIGFGNDDQQFIGIDRRRELEGMSAHHFIDDRMANRITQPGGLGAVSYRGQQKRHQGKGDARYFHKC